MNLLKFSSVICVCFHLHNANIKKCPFVIYVKKYTLLAKQNRPNITFIHNIATILDTFNISRLFCQEAQYTSNAWVGSNCSNSKDARYTSHASTETGIKLTIFVYYFFRIQTSIRTLHCNGVF